MNELLITGFGIMKVLREIKEDTILIQDMEKRKVRFVGHVTTH